MRHLLTATILGFIITSCAALDGVDGDPGPAGKAGARGAAGPVGPMGLQGVPGGQGVANAPTPVYRPAVWVSCHRPLDLIGMSTTGAAVPGKDGITETELTYELTSYTTGDIEVDCEAASGTRSATGHSFYPYTVKGAGTGVCTASDDLPPLGAAGSDVGYFVFSATSDSMAAVYSDRGHALDGMVYPFVETDCHALEMDDALTWHESTLAHAL